MNIGLLYYLANVVENIGCILATIGLIGTIGACTGLAFYWFDVRNNAYADNEKASWVKGLKVLFSICLSSLFLAIICPTKKAVLAMYIVPKLESNQKVMQITDKALDKILDILEVDEKENK